MVGYKNICARLMRFVAQINMFLADGLGFYDARALLVNLLQVFVAFFGWKVIKCQRLFKGVFVFLKTL